MVRLEDMDADDLRRLVHKLISIIRDADDMVGEALDLRERNHRAVFEESDAEPFVGYEERLIDERNTHAAMLRVIAQYDESTRTPPMAIRAPSSRGKRNG